MPRGCDRLVGRNRDRDPATNSVFFPGDNYWNANQIKHERGVNSLELDFLATSLLFV